ncbi:hypothetical protein HanIR_Chr08g0389011 [Helianthus annuus]|nr:hypothetical protein HanIR_Chr08g0389011 [Helianthus annuus]
MELPFKPSYVSSSSHESTSLQVALFQFMTDLHRFAIDCVTVMFVCAYYSQICFDYIYKSRVLVITDLCTHT